MSHNPHDFNLTLRYWDGKTAWHGPSLDGPGWYLSARENEGYVEIYPHSKISPGQAGLIAKAIDTLVQVRAESYPHLDFDKGPLHRRVTALNNSLRSTLEAEQKRLRGLILHYEKVTRDLELLNKQLPS